MSIAGELPILGISMGDPAGIGPEIIVKALSQSDVRQICRPLVIGDAQVIRQACGFVQSSLTIRSIEKVSQATFAPDMINVFDLKNVDLQKLKLGEVSAMAGH